MRPPLDVFPVGMQRLVSGSELHWWKLTPTAGLPPYPPLRRPVWILMPSRFEDAQGHPVPGLTTDSPPTPQSLLGLGFGRSPQRAPPTDAYHLCSSVERMYHLSPFIFDAHIYPQLIMVHGRSHKCCLRAINGSRLRLALTPISNDPLSPSHHIAASLPQGHSGESYFVSRHRVDVYDFMVVSRPA